MEISKEKALLCFPKLEKLNELELKKSTMLHDLKANLTKFISS